MKKTAKDALCIHGAGALQLNAYKSSKVSTINTRKFDHIDPDKFGYIDPKFQATHFPSSSRRRAAATPSVPHSLSSAGVFAATVHAAAARTAPRSSVLHQPLLWLPAAPHCLSWLFLSGPCWLQSLPTRLLSSVGVRCCLSFSLFLSFFLSFCLVSCVLCLVPCVLCLCLCCVYAFVCVCDCVMCPVSCVLCLGLGLWLSLFL